MAHSKWNISDAKARLSEVVTACGEGPQLLCNRGKAVAAVIGIDSYEAFKRIQTEAEQPSMAALLAELETLNAEEADFGEAPPRANRPQPDWD